MYLPRIHQERRISTGEERAVQMCISVRIHQERHICTDTGRAVQMCISVEFIKKDTFVQVQKELYKCVSLSNSSRKIHLYRRRKSCTNVYLCRIHQERHTCTGAERALQMCISVDFIKKNTFVQAQKGRYKCVSLSNSSRKTHLYRRRKSCTNVYLCRIHQERHFCTGTERAVQMCISVEFIKKDTFVQAQKELYKCVSLSNSSRNTHLYRRRKSCTNVYLCGIHQEGHICTGTEGAVQMCISVEFIKKDTFVQAQKELYKCVSLSNSSRKTHLYRHRRSCTNVYLCRIHQERHICTGVVRAVQMCISVRIDQERHIGTDAEIAVQMCISVRIDQERHICTGTERAVQMCISVRINQERHVGTDAEGAPSSPVQICLSDVFHFLSCKIGIKVLNLYFIY